MKFPTWNEFKEKWNNTEKEVRNKIQEFKDNHELLNKAIKTTISFLPSPFNDIASNIYDNYLGTDEEKASEVLKYFNDLQNQGEEHYKQITLRLEGILMGIDDLKNIAAKETTLLTIKETLIARDKALEDNLNQLQQQVRDLGVKVDELVDATAKILRIADMMEIQGGRTKVGTVAMQEGNAIHFKQGNIIRETITADDLKRLDPNSQMLIKTHEIRMETNFQIWSKTYSQLPLEISPISKARTEIQLKNILDEICVDLKEIITFLLRLGKHLDDHYMTFRYICNK